MMPHVMLIGGEDHHLRIPFILALRRCGYRVTAVGSGDPTPFSRAQIDFRPFRFDRFVSPRADMDALRTLPRLLAEVQPDIAQSFDLKPNLLLPLAARATPGIQVIRTINGLNFIYSSRSPLALAARPVYRILHRLAARSIAATVFQNSDDLSFFRRHGMLGRGDAVVIPGSGVDIRGFEQAANAGSSPKELRETLGVSDEPIVMTVSRMTRHKGILTLLKAAATVHAARPNVRFLLVGPRESEGPLAVTQAELDRHQPYVKAVGPRSDIPSMLRIANVFAFPTEFREGIPRALMEAALAKLPIVTTDMPGCRDVINDQWNGYLVPPHSPKALASKILDLLDNREMAQVLGGRASDTIKQKFSLDHIVAHHTSLYSKLLNGRFEHQQKIHA
ncbi:glycosyltransferase family 4 protein [Microvirga sp. BT688]|uniref:glycosyltransferase family 4 protein n=1 Tax=Microvirga sp. TaxID=1873136 RepID=UPI001682BBF2|nr:glycosyltransferase family 4 protein [Microvirga sp.]MBD2746939.1 glycosyltransferase family 4 protein [Microvirga sp.]